MALKNKIKTPSYHIFVQRSCRVKFERTVITLTRHAYKTQVNKMPSSTHFFWINNPHPLIMQPKQLPPQHYVMQIYIGKYGAHFGLLNINDLISPG